MQGVPFGYESKGRGQGEVLELRTAHLPHTCGRLSIHTGVHTHNIYIYICVHTHAEREGSTEKECPPPGDLSCSPPQTERLSRLLDPYSWPCGQEPPKNRISHAGGLDLGLGAGNICVHRSLHFTAGVVRRRQKQTRGVC